MSNFEVESWEWSKQISVSCESTSSLLGGATLLFSVELLELSKKPYFPIPTDKEFWTYAGLLVVVLLGGYELYRRANNKQTSRDKETSTTRTTTKKSKKKR